MGFDWCLLYCNIKALNFSSTQMKGPRWSQLIYMFDLQAKRQIFFGTRCSLARNEIKLPKERKLGVVYNFVMLK
jgi:hypothetical protein